MSEKPYLHKMCLSCQKVPVHPKTYCAFCGRKYSLINLSLSEYKNNYRKLAAQTTEELKALKIQRISWSQFYNNGIDEHFAFGGPDWHKERRWTLDCSCGWVIFRKIRARRIRCDKCAAVFYSPNSEWYTLIEEGNKHE